MSLLEKFTTFVEDKQDLISVKPEIFGTPIEEIYSATEARIAGNRTLLLGTNNYLGLTFSG